LEELGENEAVAVLVQAFSVEKHTDESLSGLQRIQFPSRGSSVC
jgi:hypothetical protein